MTNNDVELKSKVGDSLRTITADYRVYYRKKTGKGNYDGCFVLIDSYWFFDWRIATGRTTRNLQKFTIPGSQTAWKSEQLHETIYFFQLGNSFLLQISTMSSRL